MFSELGPDRPGNKKNKVWFLYFSLQGLSGMRQMQADGKLFFLDRIFIKLYHHTVI